MRRSRIAIAALLVTTAAVALVAVPEASAHGVRRRSPYSTRAVVKQRNIVSPSQLVAIRIGRHRTFERVVFDFRGSLPSFQSVRYVPAVRRDGSGQLVPTAGRAFLEVSFLVQCGPVPDPGASCPGTPGVRRGFRTLRQLVPAGYFESQATYGVGLSRRVGFRVFELSNPSRVVVDVRR